MASPEFGTKAYNNYATLFNTISRAPTKQHVLFSDRKAIADYLWEQGWRASEQPEGPPAADRGPTLYFHSDSGRQCVKDQDGKWTYLGPQQCYRDHGENDGR